MEIESPPSFKGGPQGSSSSSCRRPSSPVRSYILICVFCLYCLLAGPAYFNFTPLADSLIHSGAFKDRCTDAEVAAAATGVAAGDKKSYEPICTAQEAAINQLFSVASCSHFVLSSLGGLLLDLLGPRASGVVGIATAMAGWLLLAFASAPAVFTVAAVLIGMSVDTAFFPCLCLANLFPKKENTVIAFLGAFRSLAFVVPLAIRAAVVQQELASSSKVLMVYAAGCLSLCLIAALTMLPKKPFPKAEDDGALEEDSSSKQNRNNTGEGRTDVGDCEAAATTTGAGGGVLSENNNNSTMFTDKVKLQLRLFLSDACTISYLPLLPLFCLLLTNIIFFVPSASHLMPAAYKANQIIQTLSFLFCPFFGMLADKKGVIAAMHLGNCCGLLSFICVTITAPAAAGASSLASTGAVASILQHAASFLLSIQTSFLMSQLYCYVGAAFKQVNQGKLVGLVSCVAGLFSLVAVPLRDAAASNGYQKICLVCIGFSCCNILIICLLHYSLKRRQKRRQKDEGAGAGHV